MTSLFLGLALRLSTTTSSTFAWFYQRIWIDFGQPNKSQPYAINAFTVERETNKPLCHSDDFRHHAVLKPALLHTAFLCLVGYKNSFYSMPSILLHDNLKQTSSARHTINTRHHYMSIIDIQY